MEILSLNKEKENIVVSLRVKLEEAKIIGEVLTSQLKEKEDIFQEREFKIITLPKELEKTTTINFKFDNTTLILDDILNQ